MAHLPAGKMTVLVTPVQQPLCNSARASKSGRHSTLVILRKLAIAGESPTLCMHDKLRAERMARRPSTQSVRSYGTSRPGALARPSDPARAIHNQVAPASPSRGARPQAKPATRPVASVPDDIALNPAKPWPVGTWLLCAAVAALLIWSSHAHEVGELTPVEGLGYWLGIAGGLMMLSLLLYPARKHWKPLNSFGSVRLWFNTHMVLGILGPALILAHSGFELRSTNATVAMIMMALVVLSGIVGRYIYSRVHSGMSGKKAQLTELLSDVDALRNAFGEDMRHAPEIEAELAAYEAETNALRKSRYGSLRATLFLGAKSRATQQHLRGEAIAIISARALRERWDANTLEDNTSAVLAHLDAYFATVRRASTLHFFERVFRLWHFFHMPLFLLLVFAAFAHIIAVHLF